MQRRLWLTLNPYESVTRPALLTDWLELASKGQQRCVDKMVEMCRDLFETGIACRYLKWFADGVGELKARTSDGGARVYLLRIGENAFALTRAECKKESQTDPALLEWTLEVAELFDQGFEVLV